MGPAISTNSVLLGFAMFVMVISKIIVGRLRPLLNRMVDPAQVAFVPNRWINENVVLAHKIIHSFKHTGKKIMLLGN